MSSGCPIVDDWTDVEHVFIRRPGVRKATGVHHVRITCGTGLRANSERLVASWLFFGIHSKAEVRRQICLPLQAGARKRS